MYLLTSTEVTPVSVENDLGFGLSLCLSTVVTTAMEKEGRVARYPEMT